MNTFWILYLSACLVVIVVMFWNRLKVSKKTQTQEPLAEDNGGDSPQKKDVDGLRHTFDTVNMWLNNCDQKAGILLTVVGVAITVLMTSDFFKFLRNYIFAPFVEYWTGKSELSFSWGRFTVFVFLVIAVALLITSCCYLFKAIRANINYGKMLEENPGLVKKSYIFYGSISQMTYEDFKNDNVDYDNDLKSQIFVNSKIATDKFENYNKGLFWFKVLLMVSFMLFIAIMFVK